MASDSTIWEGVYPNFAEVPIEGPGFDGQEWIGNSLRKMDALRKEVKKNASLPPPSNYREGLLPLLASFVYNDQKKLRILDFGGGIGFTYYQTAQALPQTNGFEYHIVEREAVCKAGKEFFGDTAQPPIFHTELPKEEGMFDIVHISSALQYIDDWKQLVSKVCALSKKYLLLVDIYAGNIPTFVSAQCYSSSKIPMWFINFQELVQEINSLGYKLIYKSVYQPTIHGAEQSLPMQNFDEKYRLKQACNLLFVSQRADAAIHVKD